MYVELREFNNAEYPENPAPLGRNFQRYGDRKLRIVKRDESHFDFILEPSDQDVATVKLKDINLDLIIPQTPEWTRQDRGMQFIALSDREWNRQQMSFPATSEHVEVTGGDGFEEQNLYEVALAKNCLNAGLWEILLSTREGDSKKLYYQGWFTLPMGHYKNVFERNNGISYWTQFWKIERWHDPTGTLFKPDLLRTVLGENQPQVEFPLNEKVLVAGEQTRKIRTLRADNVRVWGDFFDGEHEIELASFRKPGYYDHSKPWKHRFWQIGKFEGATLRDIKPVGVNQNLQEIELNFQDTKTGERNRLLFSGIDFRALPSLPVEEYNKGLYMPLGIGIPPFYQSYQALEKNPPYESPYFGALLDSQNKWIDHHATSVDGTAMHLDAADPDLLHLYLLSYERHTLIAHFLVDLKGSSQA